MGLKTRIETSEYERSLTFYTEILGLTVLGSWDETGDRGTILGLPGSARPEAFLELADSADPASLSGVSLQLRVLDLEPIIARLRGRWEFRGPVERPWGSTYLYLTDPAGVSIIVFEGDL